MTRANQLFFGVPVVEESPDSLADSWGRGREHFSILVFTNLPLLWRLVRSRSTKRFLAACNGRIVPSSSAAGRQVRLATGRRVGAFPELQSLVRIMARVEADKAAIYLVGRAPDDLQRMEQNVRATFPSARIVGRVVFHPANLESITTAIRKAAPRIVVASLDSPRLFSWLRAHARDLGAVLCVIAPRATARMAGRNPTPRLDQILMSPGRVLVAPVLLVHRLVISRRMKRQTA